MHAGILSEIQIEAIDNALKTNLIDAGVKYVLLIDMAGNTIAKQDDGNCDVDSLAFSALAAGNFAAVDAMAKLVGETEFSILFHEGERDNLHISIVAGRVILVVIFDGRSSLGLVRLRVKKASQELTVIFDNLMRKLEDPAVGSPFAEITDEDIDNLFSD